VINISAFKSTKTTINIDQVSFTKKKESIQTFSDYGIIAFMIDSVIPLKEKNNKIKNR